MPHNIVIAGGGFGGTNVARVLERQLPSQAARVTLVNDTNHLLYTPLLPEAAAGVLEPRHVVTPLREILSRTHVRPGTIAGHDPERRTVQLMDHDGNRQELHYDQLVLAVGAVSRSLPIPGLAKYAVGFKSLADAIWLRNRIIQTLETANATDDSKRREELLTYVIVGGGYAGLEVLAELQDFAAQAVKRYPRARLHGLRWVLVEHNTRVLPEIGDRMGEYALQQLRSRGIEARLGVALTEVDAHAVRLSDGTVISSKTVVWTAGVTPQPCLANLSVPLDRGGRVVVDECMRVQGMRGVWALGDCAAVPDPAKRPRRRTVPPRAPQHAAPTACPPTAQHAIRQGRALGENMIRHLAGREPVPFAFRSRGAFVNLGRGRAIAKLGPVTVSGPLAWWLTRTYHLSQIPGGARKLRAMIDWTAGLPFDVDTSEVGTIGTPHPLEAEQYRLGGTHRPVALELEEGAARDLAELMGY